jgi:hypothetical protein
MRNGNRTRKKRRSPILFIIIILILLTLIALLVYEHFFPRQYLPAGTWVYEDDLTAYTSEVIDDWISTADYDIESTVKDSYEKVRVSIILQIDTEGNYNQCVDKDSYDAAKKAAYHDLKIALESLINARFAALGIADENGVSDEEIDELMQEAVGMSTAEYLRKAVSDILPDYETYAQAYECSGSCMLEDERIYFVDNNSGDTGGLDVVQEDGENIPPEGNGATSGGSHMLLCDKQGHTLTYNNSRMLLDDVIYEKIDKSE